MKTLLAALLFASIMPLTAPAADGPVTPAPNPGAPGGHRVVVELTSADTRVWNGALNNIENLREALGAATQVAVVAHGAGLGFLLRTNTAQAARMKRLADAGVVFDACRNTMRREHVTAQSLLPFATTVDSGVAEVVRRQEAGWSYIHIGN